MFFEIATSRGVILVDQADAELVAPYNWYAVPVGNSRFYAHARCPGAGRGGKRILMHRFLMEPPPGMVVHHRNGNGLDNRRANLEITTQRENIRYAYDGRDIGVHFHKKTGKWRAQLRDNAGKFVSLGLHETKDDALSVAKEFRPTP